MGKKALRRWLAFCLLAAMNAVPANASGWTLIYLKNGTYQEVVTVNKPYISLVGQSESGTVITYNNYSGKAKPGGGTYTTADASTVFVTAHDFLAYNLTFQNSAGNVGQAEAMFVTADRALFYRTRMLGWQDTLYAGSGRQY